jgi:hypothetical protein
LMLAKVELRNAVLGVGKRRQLCGRFAVASII